MDAEQTDSPEQSGKMGEPSTISDFVESETMETQNVIPTREYQMLPMVGLGGSAGSIQALLEFFKAMPSDSGMAFVVILHLSPTHESILPELLSRTTLMKVTHAVHGQEVEPDHVYVIPPGKYLMVLEGCLQLVELDQGRGSRVAVDLFFRSLADTHGPHATAIVLSGGDGDGALGIKRVKERGGLTIAQDPTQAEQSGMPQSAIDTGMIDWVLEVSEIPRRLIDYRSQEKRIRLPPEDGPLTISPYRAKRDDSETAFSDVLIFLRMRTGRDFTCYKRATILRRIARRMQVNSVDDLPAYLNFLRTHPGEAGALLQDLLISVTNFFRDRDAFEALERHIPSLFKGKSEGDSVRVWVPACATGEEAYSLAMLLMEHANRIERPPGLQVFACDLDDHAIQLAREGSYPETISADVSEDRLRSFFVKDSRGFRVRRELREMVLFASHDLLKDAPFSRMDLISCRNLLIYLNRDAQKRVFETFHFALKEGGRLFLGSSEAVEDGSPLFRVLDKKHRIYSVQPAARINLPVPPGPNILSRALEAQERAKAATFVHGKRFVKNAAVEFQGQVGVKLDRAALAELHFRLLERFAPPSLIINTEQEVVHLSETAGQLLKFSGGEPSMKLLRMVNPALRIELRAMLYRAAESNEAVEATNLPMEIDGQARTINIRVVPASDIAPGFQLVIFQLNSADARPISTSQRTRLPSDETAVQQIERELEQVQGYLRDTVEQYEASTEELKASNEELQAMNEELRSATEELETSREELQSINEELVTVNLEMKSKVDEVANTNSDLQNLMASTAIATVFLDRNLEITRYTPSAVDLFNLIPTDVGRPLAHLKHLLDYPELIANAAEVLRTLVPIEREVQDEKRWFLSRLQPYRSLEDHIAGVVLTFVDITERRMAECAMASDLRDVTTLLEVSEHLIPDGETQNLFNAILNAAVVLTHADAGTIHLLEVATNELRLLAVQGVETDVAIQFSNIYATPDSVWGRVLASGKSAVMEFESLVGWKSRDQLPREQFLELRTAQVTPLVARTGLPIGVLSTCWKASPSPGERQLRFFDLLARQAADAIERRQSEEELRGSEERLRLLIESAKDYAVFTIDTNCRICCWNLGAEAMFGYTSSEISGQLAEILFAPDDRTTGAAQMELQIAREDGRAAKERWHCRKDGKLFYGSGSVMPLREKSGELRGFVKIVRDLTESIRHQETLREQMEELTRFNAVAVDRENRMIELKSEVNELCVRCGESPRYTIMVDVEGE